MRSVSPSPPHSAGAPAVPGPPSPLWQVSTACSSFHVPPQVPGSWTRWVVGAPGHPPALPPLLPLPQPKLTPQEKLKLRMQKALNRQCMCPSLSPSSRLLSPAWPWEASPFLDREALGEERCAPPLRPRAEGLGHLVGLSEFSFCVWEGGLESTPQPPCPSLPTVKADKKAAQEKMIQQEHERQVGVG